MPAFGPARLAYLSVTASALVASGCQSLGGIPTAPFTSALDNPAAEIHFRGARPAYVWRSYGRTRRLIRFATPIQHVVVVSMENRTVDDLFAAYYFKAWPGAGGGTWGSALNLRDPHVRPTLAPNALTAKFDPSHGHEFAWAVESQGNWNQEKLNCPHEKCPSSASAYSYVPSNETGIYEELLEKWAFVNNVLQANEGPSFIAHQYYIAAQSGGLPGALTSPDAEAENPVTPRPHGAAEDEDGVQIDVDSGGCTPGSFIEKTVNMSLPVPTGTPLDNGPALNPPCEEYNTILDEIAKALGPPDVDDWQYIAHAENSIWAAPMGVKHLYEQYLRTKPADEPFAVDPDAANFARNISKAPSPAPSPVRPFAALTYITPCGSESDHPMATLDGPQWLAWILNKIGESSAWKSTVVFVTWDDWGGFYDHVPSVGPGGTGPIRPNRNGYHNPDDPNEWGFRVPLIIISPYVKQRGYISNRATSGFRYRSQTAIMQFVEAAFGLHTLGGDDRQNGHHDALADVFDFSQKPLPYVPLHTSFKPPSDDLCPTKPKP
jgi:phospholipase C